MAKFYQLSLGMLAGALTMGVSQQASARQLSVDEALASARLTSKVAPLRGSRSGGELKLVHHSLPFTSSTTKMADTLSSRPMT